MIPVGKKGKFMPDISEFIFMQSNGEDVFFVHPAIYNLTQRIDHRAVSAMMNAIAIGSYAVNTNYIALVFDGPGR